MHPDTNHPYHNTWGKLNAGQRFGIVAYDLDRALACAGLTKHEAILMQAIREQNWGPSARNKPRGAAWPEALPRPLPIRTLARKLDAANHPTKRRLLFRAKASLLADALLIEQADTVQINKQVHQWTRLTPEEIAYAAQAQPGRGDYPAAAPGRGDSSVIPPVTQVSPPRCLKCHPPGDRSVTPPVTQVSPPPYKERARVLDSQKINSECGGEGNPPTQSSLSPEADPYDLDALFGPDPNPAPKGAH